jgi:hypothetical protein
MPNPIRAKTATPPTTPPTMAPTLVLGGGRGSGVGETMSTDGVDVVDVVLDSSVLENEDELNVEKAEIGSSLHVDVVKTRSVCPSYVKSILCGWATLVDAHRKSVTPEGKMYVRQNGAVSLVLSIYKQVLDPAFTSRKLTRAG